ncbi:unnamed protein product [Hymenolepis diminuta]|uniref:Uncharacterized protein n=1 Tax=Hymenolepis diminuta TaxID=6216 RepID=A0A564Y1J7_HYMDI|nr:unnamed protein product [Hymenolepis diminuta]
MSMQTHKQIMPQKTIQLNKHLQQARQVHHLHPALHNLLLRRQQRLQLVR